jgi:dTDP-4-amino-4,6-dideoxygalactose transaminase
MSIIKPCYNLGFGKFTMGKMLLFLAQKLKLLSFPVYEKEKRGKKPDIFPAKLPGALAILALNQLNKLDRFVFHRRKIANIYRNNLDGSKFNLPQKKKGESHLRFPVLHKKAREIYKDFKNRGILLGNWYDCPVVPCADKAVTKYKSGSNKKTEKVSTQVLNLPTYIGLSEKCALEITKLLNKWKK